MTSRASIQRNFNVVTSNFCIVKAYQTIGVRNLTKHDYYRPSTKLLEGNVFTGVQGVGGYLWSHIISLGGVSGTTPLLGVGVGMYRGGWVCPGCEYPSPRTWDLRGMGISRGYPPPRYGIQRDSRKRAVRIRLECFLVQTVICVQFICRKSRQRAD